MRKTTLCFLLKKDSICLAMKKVGFGMGKVNGIGGKVEEGETVKWAALRELKEEIQVGANEEDLEEVGDIKFTFNKKPEWAQHMHIFFIRKWKGQPQETEEMKPAWYLFKAIPYDLMWIDDRYWLPRALQGKKIKREFLFNNDGSKILSQKITEKD